MEQLRGWTKYLAAALVASTSIGAQSEADDLTLKALGARTEAYARVHRKIEGPIPPLAASRDMAEVMSLMGRMRKGIRSERPRAGRGSILTDDVIALLRKRVRAALTDQDLEGINADVEEHTPAGLPRARVNEPLPADAPFVPLPPQLLSALPPLPPELRYLVLAKALVLWDHHANMVVDIAPKVFDATTYARRGTN